MATEMEASGRLTVWQHYESLKKHRQKKLMKTTRILQLGVVSLTLSHLPAQAGFIPTGQDPSSPYYADFTSSGLSISYIFAGGVGTFTAKTTTVPSASGAYTSGPLSPGTHGADDATGFVGSYSLTAKIQDIGGLWEVTSGSFVIDGALPGVSTGSGDLLLSGNLKTGAGTIGYSDTGTKNPTTFDFLYTVSGGNSTILKDFFGANTGQGGIIFNTGALNVLPTENNGNGYTDLAHNFANLGSGQGDTFVPEPAAYPLAASVLAFLGFSLARRKQS
jgi:hypothetical protein